MGNSNHFSMKTGKVGKGGAHAEYVSGLSRYADREDVRLVESANLPGWASDAAAFWKAADEHERANGRVYRELEFALPSELTQAQQIELARAAATRWIGKKHAYTLAVHDKPASDGKTRNVHCHLMFCERVNDGIPRQDAPAFFKRGASKGKDPASGGARKDEGWKRREKLVDLRADWAELANAHLLRNGHKPRMDTRSNFERELPAPEPKIGPSRPGSQPDELREARLEKVELHRSAIRARGDLQRELEMIRQEARADDLLQKLRQNHEQQQRELPRKRERDRGSDLEM